VVPPPTGRGGLLLDGIRVVEFGVAAVVPELCWMLSELGADVIKIESTTHPDVLRQTGMGRIDCGFAFNTECRGRRSVALDLSTERGRELALELCATADVVAENNRGGVLERLGLGYAAVAARNPAVVYASSQGYGVGGPFGEMPAYGPLNAGFAGIHLLWNHPDAPYPCGTSLNHPDHIAGKLLGVAVLAALGHRAVTGEGQHIDMAQTEAAAYLLGEVYLDAATTPYPTASTPPPATTGGWPSWHPTTRPGSGCAPPSAGSTSPRSAPCPAVSRRATRSTSGSPPGPGNDPRTRRRWRSRPQESRPCR
jgi:crotonobetainyl-CoA:carnitine CoA-transferase CaiB-like acyl-CoA transferase